MTTTKTTINQQSALKSCQNCPYADVVGLHVTCLNTNKCKKKEKEVKP